jgi:hypothetical protein
MWESVLTLSGTERTLAFGFDYDRKIMNSKLSVPGWTLHVASQTRHARSPANGCSAAILVSHNIIA